MSVPATGRTGNQPLNLDLVTTFKVIWPYLREKFLDQIKSIWFIVAYLLFFQIVVLGLPRKASLGPILAFAFLVGVGATFAEPAIAVLRAAGRGVSASDAPVLFSLLNDFPEQLVAVVGAGVGIAVALGILRFFFDWSLKTLIIPLVLLLVALTLWTYSNETLRPIIGLAWDSGAVTTGPVTVPLVLALGIGVCRIVGQVDSSTDGFGIVTLASLLPILAVLLLGNAHYWLADTYGAVDCEGTAVASTTDDEPPESVVASSGFTNAELERYINTGELPEDAEVRFGGGEVRLERGTIIHESAEVRIVRLADQVQQATDGDWDPRTRLNEIATTSAKSALQAVIPLCAFLFLTLRLLRERLEDPQMIGIGVVFAVFGMALFGRGITIGLTPLGTQLGTNIPSAFAAITPWGMLGQQGPLFDGVAGKLMAILFGFFLGYGATLAEPALNALGETVQKITVGAFRKSLLMHSVAVGVALGIGAGVCKIAFDIPLVFMLIPPYLLLCWLTWISSEEFVNFGWDSAGVTTGPITVPLVLAMGLGIGANVPGASDGFGILALASVGPILTVLSVGLLVARAQRSRMVEAS